MKTDACHTCEQSRGAHFRFWEASKPTLMTLVQLFIKIGLDL